MNTTDYSGSAEQALASIVAGYSACGWAFIFGAVHIYWGVGGTIGLQGNSMSGLLFMINLVAIPLCFVAAVVAIALVKSWSRWVPVWMWLTAAWGASILLTLRGTVGLLQSILTQNQVPLLLMAYDTWFLLGGILFSVVAISNRREGRSLGPDSAD